VREEFLIDALADYEIAPDDPNRSVPNPARKGIEKQLRRMRTPLGKLRGSYAAITLDARPRRLPRTEAKKARKNSAPRSPRPKPVSKNSRPSTTLFLGACPWPRLKRDKQW